MHVGQVNEGQLKEPLIAGNSSLNCADNAKGTTLLQQTEDFAAANLTEPAPSPTLEESMGIEHSVATEGRETRAGAPPVYLELELANKLLERAGGKHSIGAAEGHVLGESSSNNADHCDVQLPNGASMVRLHTLDSLRTLLASSVKCDTVCVDDPTVQAELLQYCRTQPAVNVICFAARGARKQWIPLLK